MKGLAGRFLSLLSRGLSLRCEDELQAARGNESATSGWGLNLIPMTPVGLLDNSPKHDDRKVSESPNGWWREFEMDATMNDEFEVKDWVGVGLKRKLELEIAVKHIFWERENRVTTDHEDVNPGISK